MSLNRNKIDFIFDFIDECIKLPEGHKWYTFECDVCKEQCCDEYVHFSIEEEFYFKDNPDVIRFSK